MQIILEKNKLQCYPIDTIATISHQHDIYRDVYYFCSIKLPHPQSHVKIYSYAYVYVYGPKAAL